MASTAKTDALLEIAAVLLEIDADGNMVRSETIRYHVKPFEGANMEAASLAVNGIDPHHPLRPAIDERDALQRSFREVRRSVRENRCSRAVLVGHNAHFDLGFLNEAIERSAIKRNPFHPFSCFDTATLGRRGIRTDSARTRIDSRGNRLGRNAGALCILRCRDDRRSVL